MVTWPLKDFVLCSLHFCIVLENGNAHVVVLNPCVLCLVCILLF